MHELNIVSSQPSYIFLNSATNLASYKSKIEKYNINLDIFVSDTSVVWPENFIYLWGNNILGTTDTPLFGSDFSICVVCPSGVDKKWVPEISGNLMVKNKLPPQSGSHSSLEAVEPHPWKRAIKSFHKKGHLRIDQDCWSSIGKIILRKGRIQAKLGLGCKQVRLVSCCM